MTRPAALTASVLALLAMLAPSAARAEEPGLEYPVKAAFLYQFARFTDWPEEARSDAPLAIGILGDDPFGAVLDKALEGKSVGGRALTIRRSTFALDLDGCSILFVSRSETHRLAGVLGRVARSPVLTVGESEGFTQSGGMIRFVVDGSHVRFEVNLAAVESGGLRLSSRLLALARITGRGTGAR
jgi:hypothetical protein